MKEVTANCLLVFLILIYLLPTAVAFACVISDMDAFYLLLDKFLLPNKYTRTLKISLFHSCIRFCIYISVATDGVRSVCLYFCNLIIFFHRANSIMRLFQRNCWAWRKFYPEYKACYIIVMCVLRPDLDRVFYVMLYLAFWVLVGGLWFVITQDPSVVSYFMYFCIVSLVIAFSVVLFILCPLLCGILEKSENCIRLHRFVSAFEYSRTRSRKCLADKLLGKTVRPMQLRYGQFEFINRKFLVNFFWNVVLRTFDAIIIFDGWV